MKLMERSVARIQLLDPALHFDLYIVPNVLYKQYSATYNLDGPVLRLLYTHTHYMSMYYVLNHASALKLILDVVINIVMALKCARKSV